MERVVGVLEELQRGARAELLHQWFEQLALPEIAPRALQEQHRYLDLEQVRAALVGRLAGCVQRKAEEHQSAHAWQRRLRLGLRAHAPAIGLAAREQRQA